MWHSKNLRRRGEASPSWHTLEAIQQARVVTRVVFIVAHPDDEASTLLTYLPHGLGTHHAAHAEPR